jgi:hypothetical protein
MNRSVMTLSGLIIILFALTSYGFNKESLKDSEIRKSAVASLLLGIQSDNYGLRTSSAFMLGEIRAEEAVIPLMHMLHTEKSENARIVAALSLYKIDNPRGLFAVKQATRFDSSERVRKMCTNFYYETLKVKYELNNLVKENSEVAIR